MKKRGFTLAVCMLFMLLCVCSAAALLDASNPKQLLVGLAHIGANAAVAHAKRGRKVLRASARALLCEQRTEKP